MFILCLGFFVAVMNFYISLPNHVLEANKWKHDLLVVNSFIVNIQVHLKNFTFQQRKFQQL